MPQEFHAVQCFNCETFQVEIVKKTPKWCCKICSEKQSVRKVYGTGTGKECRLLVQSLNERRLTQSIHPVILEDEKEPETCTRQVVDELPSFSGDKKNGERKSKWFEFVDNPVEAKCDVLLSSDNIFEDETTDYDSFLRL